MQLGRLAVGCEMTLRQLWRSALAVLLLFLLPAIFFAAILLTTSHRTIRFELATVPWGAIPETPASRGRPALDLLDDAPEWASIAVPERDEALVFVSVAAVGLLSSFLAMSLIRKSAGSNRRLILCGFGTWELVLSKVVALAGVIGLVCLYVGGVLPLLIHPQRFGVVILGLALTGWVYGCYGLLVGLLCKRELEAMLFVVLLTNIDAGWLQNPIYYATAVHPVLIRSLPAFLPSQVCMAAAFTGVPVASSALGSVAYGAALLALALLFQAWRTASRR
jgi:hypothetical protein